MGHKGYKNAFTFAYDTIISSIKTIKKVYKGKEAKLKGVTSEDITV